MNNWIKVSDRLPDEECVDYLVVQFGSVYIGEYRGVDIDGDTVFVSAGDTQEMWNVTHWMPLPEPPQD